ncbi:polyribonucleotide nucleotidyltransferase [Limisalsivibrio acetivorans]|uniref:polyribonucleotide nucleotidyltransferase n=1 Tax=Limisalsivibrio acetivorans TaxID=1304888 RepID=UPI0003B71DEE|nr:polyribonucleotide nucleotidyltransferase [Limisalsivibrio acetivorans]
MEKETYEVSVQLSETAEPIVFETGWKAKQANGSIWIRQGGTVILVTATGRKEASDTADFFPLTVNYIEKFYSVGKVPGGFLKRENRPSDKETLTSRLIDRPLRPMFPDGFRNETQVICTVVSFDGKNMPDMLATNAASAALMISDIPFNGPIAGVRVGKKDGELIIDPSYEIFDELDMNIIVCGNDDAINMVEAGMNMVTEDEVIEALEFAHANIKKIIAVQRELTSQVGKDKFEYKDFSVPKDLIAEAEAELGQKIHDALVIPGKLDKYAALDEIRDSYFEKLEETLGEEYAEKKSLYKEVWHSVEKKVFREFTLGKGERIDGRGPKDVRPIDIEVDLLPMPHGSALFTRGETQGLVTATLGTKTDTQMLDNIEGSSKKRFMLHYNFPPFCVGEVGFLRAPGRREIGHGALAERSLLPILPDEEEFPYSIRVVSEILESNGSSSMASVCGGCLSLMDAGVPVKGVVAGVAMGLIKEGDRHTVLSDIMGTEDHLGDMDFKVAGTEDGITALQMDIKIEGLSRDLLVEALSQAKESRLHILSKMKECLAEPRAELSETAPRYISMKINPEKIGLLIGPGGKNIRSIVDDTGAQIDIDDEGVVNVFAVDKESIDAAIARINETVQELEDDKVYTAKVKKIMDYGAFVELIPGVEALLHVSQYSNERIQSIADYLKVGDEVDVKYQGKDQNGRHKISRKVLL